MTRGDQACFDTETASYLYVLQALGFQMLVVKYFRWLQEALKSETGEGHWILDYLAACATQLKDVLNTIATVWFLTESALTIVRRETVYLAGEHIWLNTIMHYLLFA